MVGKGSVMVRKRTRYTDEERANLVVMLEAQGYPEKKGSLAYVARYAKVPESTLRGWFKARRNPPPAIMRDKKREDLADKFEDIAYVMLDHAGGEDVIEEMKGKDAVMSAAIATDKMRLLRGLPTEIVAIMPNFIQAIENMGQSPHDVMSRIIERSSQLESNDLQH